MDAEVWFVLAAVAGAIVLFATELVSFDLTAMALLAVLLIGGVISTEEALSGMSSPATVAIGCMFILSEGLRRCGVIDRCGKMFLTLGGGRPERTLLAMMLSIGLISAFINNTAAVAIFIPMVMGAAHQMGRSPSELLMPLSFISMIGGVCTLIGTSTNLLVSSIATQRGLDGFTMFEFAPLGGIFLVVGLVYMQTIGPRLLPKRAAAGGLSARFEMKEYLTDVRVTEGSPLVGVSLGESDPLKELDLDILSTHRGAGRSYSGRLAVAITPLQVGDSLRVRAAPAVINQLVEEHGLELLAADAAEAPDVSDAVLVEAVVAPGSALVGRSLAQLDISQRLEAVPLALRSRGLLSHQSLTNAPLLAGDTLLLMMPLSRVQQLDTSPLFVLATEVRQPTRRTGRAALAVALLVGVVAVAALTSVPIVTTALVGAVLMVGTGCLTTAEAYEAINWKVIFLLAGVIPLGAAMENSGATELISDLLVQGIGQVGGPHAAVAGFFGASLLLTNVISNQATAALLAPVAIAAAPQLDVEPRMLLVALTFAASLSFLSPVGYQTNTMIYGPGEYRFTDYLRVGLLLDLILWAGATVLIPIFWG